MLILVFGGQYVDHHSLLRVKAHPSILCSTVSTYYVLHTNLVCVFPFVWAENIVPRSHLGWLLAVWFFFPCRNENENLQVAIVINVYPP